MPDHSGQHPDPLSHLADLQANLRSSTGDSEDGGAEFDGDNSAPLLASNEVVDVDSKALSDRCRDFEERVFDGSPERGSE